MSGRGAEARFGTAILTAVRWVSEFCASGSCGPRKTGNSTPPAAHSDLDPRRLIFIDEIWAKTNKAPTHGRPRRGQRLVARVSFGH